MFLSFFSVAAKSPARQFTFRALLVMHLLILAACFFMVRIGRGQEVVLLGQCLLVAGIVEGALLMGWRLTQLPKSRALEFLLASPLRPHLVFLAEAAVGLSRLALITLSSLPLLLILVQDGFLDYRDLVFLLLMPFTWGSITGIGLTAWAYEPVFLRRVGQRLMMVLILFYLVVGILAGENLRSWLNWLPYGLGQMVIGSFHAFHQYNPFAVMQSALLDTPQWFGPKVLLLGIPAILIALLLLARAACRFQAHYQERHYSPVADVSGQKRKAVGDRPLSWWAVKRVSEYAGKVNLWLAGGFGLLYALHTLAGPHWPAWMGRHAFLLFDHLFGVAGVATALMVLAAVPAAFQYGLWDSNTQDRCRRLELLLLSKLDANDYWQAALAAAWARGRGYALVALLLWVSAAVSGRIGWEQMVLAVTAGMLMWLMYFALGFRAFSTGMQASNLGLLLTAGLPLGTVALYRAGFPALAGLTPPGCVYLAGVSNDPWLWLPGIFLMAGVILVVNRLALSRCLEELRRWYERFHGQKVLS